MQTPVPWHASELTVVTEQILIKYPKVCVLVDNELETYKAKSSVSKQGSLYLAFYENDPKFAETYLIYHIIGSMQTITFQIQAQGFYILLSTF